ncbi:MAG: hypothetical protein JNK00_13180 [Flavipsychrobacter sp.]|nr:hypothetical protein [Flavipsychrobacter sp.]
MGRLSSYLLEYSNVDHENISLKDSIKFCYLDVAPKKNAVLELNSFAILNESVQGLIDNFLNGVLSTNDIISELREDIDIIFHLIFEERLRLNKILNIESGDTEMIAGIKINLENIINSYDRWKDILDNDNLEEIVRTSGEIFECYNIFLNKSMDFLNKKYTSYALVSLSFLVLALLSNILKQGISFISNKALRFISYYNRATNYAIIDSFANILVMLENDNEELFRSYTSKDIRWPDGKCLIIEGDIKKGYIFKVYKENVNTGNEYAGMDSEFTPPYSGLDDIMSKYEGKRLVYFENTFKISFIKLAIHNCNVYAGIINSYIAKIGSS